MEKQTNRENRLMDMGRGVERVWRKGNPLTLLVGMQTGTATVEDSVEIPENLEIELPYNPAIPLLGIHTEETRIERDTQGNQN